MFNICDKLVYQCHEIGMFLEVTVQLLISRHTIDLDANKIIKKYHELLTVGRHFAKQIE